MSYIDTCIRNTYGRVAQRDEAYAKHARLLVPAAVSDNHKKTLVDGIPTGVSLKETRRTPSTPDHRYPSLCWTAVETPVNEIPTGVSLKETRRTPSTPDHRYPSLCRTTKKNNCIRDTYRRVAQRDEAYAKHARSSVPVVVLDDHRKYL
ncbi:hypothetical protein FS749_014478 [Ceratobasidium sp. UAMH 11750]|nr:hypothetical protein FS749_014478 [Ceratobasidium sp. UAMH 11750]